MTRINIYTQFLGNHILYDLPNTKTKAKTCRKKLMINPQ